jgi:thiol:disulfide interchange protein
MKLALAALLVLLQTAPLTKYDPKRNADQDIKNAVTQAQKMKKRVLLEVGGEWCKWCHIMDKYFADHPDLTELRNGNYVTVKINFSPENDNKAVLSRYPQIPGYPHIFVLDSDGKLLQSEGTSVLEEGESYNLTRFTEFLQKWAPPTTQTKP